MSSGRTNTHLLLHYAKIYFILLLLLLISLCIPVTGLMNISVDNAKQIPALRNATEYENQGKALLSDRDWSGVIASTREGLMYYPYNPELLCLQGYAMRKTGHYQEAADLISLAIPNDTRPVRYANRGYALLAMGKNQEAINDADSALARDSSYATAYALKAFALRNTGDLSAAEETIDKALRIDPGNAHYLHVKGGILADMGNCTGATMFYQRSIQRNPDYDLPWPGLSNATVDLEKTKTRCYVPGTAALPATAGFPCIMLFSGGIIAAFIMVRRGS